MPTMSLWVAWRVVQPFLEPDFAAWLRFLTDCSRPIFSTISLTLLLFSAYRLYSKISSMTSSF